MPRIACPPLLPPFARPHDARLSRLPGRLAALGALVVLAVPAARGHSALLGWLPLWLVAMPASSAWVLAGCPVPRWAGGARRRSPQARRCPARARARAG